MTENAVEPRLGASLPTVSRTVTWDDMQRFERVVWDRGLNVHNDPSTATREGLDRPIASGQHQLAFVHEMLEAAFGSDWATGGRIKMRYLHPVYDNDVVTAHGEITAVREVAPGRHDVKVSIWCEKDGGVRTAAGVARITVGADQPSQQPPTGARALDGVRVLELTHAWAGPYAGMMLADMGADVVKIERPDQDPEARGGYPYIGTESVPFILLHRNKKSVTIDLKSERGRNILLRMVTDADVLIENFRPGTLERLGLGYERLSVANPRIILASISGFGGDVDSATLPGVNMVAQAVNGMAATSMTDGGPPAPLGTALCDILAGMWTAYGITCALREREATGKGQHVGCSLVQAGLSVMHAHLAVSLFARKDSDAADHKDINAPSGFYPTAEGRFVAIFASYPKLWTALVEALDRPELADDERFATRLSRTTHARELREILEPVIAAKPLEHWLGTLGEAGVPVAPLMDLADAMRSGKDYIWDLIEVVEHPSSGAVPLLRSPVTLSRSPTAIAHAAPLLGEHTDVELSRLGLADELASLRSEKVIG
jgi:CoA:oxalate CoA-transferase